MQQGFDELGSLDEVLAALYDDINSPTPWSRALERLRLAMGTNSVCLRLVQKGGKSRENLFVAGPMACPEAIAEWERRDTGELGPVHLRVGEHDVVDWSLQANDPGLAEMLDRYDTRQMLTMCIDRHAGIDCFLNCDRGVAQPDFSRQDIAFFRMAGAHFGRAIRLRRAIASDHALNQVKSDALDRLSTAIFLMTPIGEVRAVNGCAERLISEGECFNVRGGALHACDDYVDRAIQATVQAMLRDGAEDHADERPRFRIFSVPRADGERTCNLLIVSAPFVSLLTNRPERCVLMYVRDDHGLTREDGHLLRAMFSFTAAEAKIAVDVANGMSVDEISRCTGASRNTVRAHLRAIYIKTGMRRQADIVHTLTHSVVPLGRLVGQEQRSL